MKLKMYKREGGKRSALGDIRRQGDVPAVLYSAGKGNEMIAVDGEELGAILRKIVPGRLSTTQFTLVDGEREVLAIVKEVQYHPTTYKVTHMDFMMPQRLVKVRVPVECVGVNDCQGIKLGGLLRQVIRYVKVECPSDQIPERFCIDIRDLVIGQAKRLSDLVIPAGLRPLVDMKQVIVVIAKR